MNTPAAFSLLDASPAISVGTCIVPLAADAITVDGKATRRMMIAPRGAVEARDGRAFSFNPENLAARYVKDGIPIPLDIDHAIPIKGALGERADAVGWVTNLTAEPDGLYGDFELLEPGRAALTARTHRFLSPGVTHTADGEVNWIHSVALVAAPALPMVAVASASGTGATPPLETSPEPSMKQVAQALGLQPEASEAACLSAITALGAGKVDQAVHDATLADLTETSANLAALQASIAKTSTDSVLEEALKAKKILPSEREHFANLAATSEGLKSVKALIDARPAQLGASGLNGMAVDDGADDTNPVVLANKARAHQAQLAATGVTISIAQAVNEVSAPGYVAKKGGDA